MTVQLVVQIHPRPDEAGLHPGKDEQRKKEDKQPLERGEGVLELAANHDGP